MNNRQPIKYFKEFLVWKEWYNKQLVEWFKTKDNPIDMESQLGGMRWINVLKD